VIFKIWCLLYITLIDRILVLLRNVTDSKITNSLVDGLSVRARLKFHVRHSKFERSTNQQRRGIGRPAGDNNSLQPVWDFFPNYRHVNSKVRVRIFGLQ